MQESKSCALPLGYTPPNGCSITHLRGKVKEKITASKDSEKEDQSAGETIDAQLIGAAPLASRNAFAREKWRQPKKPL